MAIVRTINFKRLSEGSVSLYLQDVEGVLPTKWFTMTHQQPKTPVPLNYALSIFLDNVLQQMLQDNYFEIIEVEALKSAAIERGLISDDVQEPVSLEISTPKKSAETILAILKGGNETKIKELFKSADKERAFDIAKANSKILSNGTVSFIEDILGMAITEE
jgi:hypothetical protein